MIQVNGLHFDNIRGDIYGGLTAAVVALPLAMAMGVASGAGPLAGLYGAIFVGFFAALLGGTPSQVSGPTGPMTVVMAAIFIQYTGMYPDDPSHGAALAFTVVVFGGLFQISFGLLKLGKYIELVPLPVVSGFMTGIGVIIILLQFGPLLGHAADSNPLQAAQSIPNYLNNFETTSIILGIVTLIVVYGVPTFLPKVSKIIPSPLLALFVGTLTYLFIFPDSNTAIIGDIPTGLPDFQMPIIDSALLFQMLASGLTLAGLGTIDSLLTSLVADKVTRSQHKPDRELIGQGIGNTVAGLFGGLPGAGATMRTVVNVKAGGRTPISGTLHSVILLLIVLGAGSLASDIPNAVLAGILIKVGTDIVDWDYLKRLHRTPRAGVIIMLTVLIITVTIDLLLAFGVGMVMASFIFMQRITDIQIENMYLITSPNQHVLLNEQETDIFKQANNNILLFNLNGPLSFSSAKALTRSYSEITSYKILILDLSNVQVIDFTISQAINDVITDTQNAGKSVLICVSEGQVQSMLYRQDIITHFDKDNMHNNRVDAFIHASNILKT